MAKGLALEVAIKIFGAKRPCRGVTTFTFFSSLHFFSGAAINCVGRDSNKDFLLEILDFGNGVIAREVVTLLDFFSRGNPIVQGMARLPSRGCDFMGVLRGQLRAVVGSTKRRENMEVDGRFPLVVKGASSKATSGWTTVRGVVTAITVVGKGGTVNVTAVIALVGKVLFDTALDSGSRGGRCRRLGGLTTVAHGATAVSGGRWEKDGGDIKYRFGETFNNGDVMNEEGLVTKGDDRRVI